MKVEQICTREVVAIAGDESLQRAAMLMRERHVGALVITESRDDGDHVLGVVTDRDLAIEVISRGGDASQVPVGRLVQGPAATVAADADLAAAVDVMRAAGVRRLLVHDEHGHLAGLLSFDDLLPALLAPLAGLSEVLQRGRQRETQQRGALSAPPRPVLRVPAMGTAGWQASSRF